MQFWTHPTLMLSQSTSLIKFGLSCFSTELIRLLYVTVLFLTCAICGSIYACRFWVILTLVTMNLPNLIPAAAAAVKCLVNTKHTRIGVSHTCNCALKRAPVGVCCK